MVNDMMHDFLHTFVILCLDDFFVYNRTLEEHIEHLLRLVLRGFKEGGLNLSPKNCFFGIQDMDYLGYTLSGGKISVPNHKVNVVKDKHVPTTQREARSFVQLHSFYAKSKHHFSDIVAPLTDLLRKHRP
jgi:hypothetical protein